jgi:hypothetical protein
MQLLHCELMQPNLPEDFLEGMRAEFQSLASDLRLKAMAGQRDRAAVDRKIANLVEAISDGRSSPAILAKLTELEAARLACADAPRQVGNRPPTFEPGMPGDYTARIAQLTAAFQRTDDPETREAMRILINKVVVDPPADEDEPPHVERIGDLMALLHAAKVPGAQATPPPPALTPFSPCSLVR